MTILFNSEALSDTVPLLQPVPIRQVPRSIAEAAYAEYAKQYGTEQSFERLHERGGFGVLELMGLLYDRIERLEQS